jgi:sterol desaturase/sphingolipid hydroxylase (fatty acid hydroxylase superfamily)
LAALLLSPFVGAGAALPLAAGLVLGYVGVTLSHARFHQRAPQGRWEEWMWRFHFHHHYGDARTNFGLTSPIFDFAFGTAVVPDEVAIPEGSLPAWWSGAHRGFKVQKGGPGPRAAG